MTHELTTGQKEKMLNTTMMTKLDEYLPKKERKISSDDQPWVSEKMKKFKRLKEREYQKHRKSIKYLSLQSKYQFFTKSAKKEFYNKFIKNLKQTEPGKWYSKLKRICSYDEQKSAEIEVDEIKHLP